MRDIKFMGTPDVELSEEQEVIIQRGSYQDRDLWKQEGLSNDEIEAKISAIRRFDEHLKRMRHKDRRVPKYAESSTKASKDQYLNDLKQRVGFVPRPAEYPEQYTSRTTISIDSTVKTSEGRLRVDEYSRLALEIASKPFEGRQETAVEHMRHIIMTEDFTVRERTVYKKVYSQGKRKQDVADELDLSPNTISNIVKRIKEKLSGSTTLKRYFRIF